MTTSENWIIDLIGNILPEEFYGEEFKKGKAIREDIVYFGLLKSEYQS